MHLQPIFAHPILEQTDIAPGYSGHASEVWRVRTAEGTVVVRMSRVDAAGGTARVFWEGCRHLFGIEPREVFAHAPLNDLLNHIGALRAPRVLRQGWLGGRPYIVVEHLPGHPPTPLRDQPEALLEHFGTVLGRLHRHGFAWYGSPTGAARYPLASFPAHLAVVLRALVDGHYRADAEITGLLAPMVRAAQALPSPEHGAFVMVDLGASQFLAQGERLTAVVDTEAYVVGPRELDFVALEYELDARAARVFARGYRSVLPLPALTTVRPVYRYLTRLLGVRGAVDLHDWLAHLPVFDAL